MNLRSAVFSLIFTVICMIGYFIFHLFAYAQYDESIIEQLEHIDNDPPSYLSPNNAAYFKINRAINSSDQYDDKRDINFKNSANPINQIRDKWQLALYDIFIKYEFLPFLLQNDQYSASIEQFMPNLNETPNLDDNIKIFNQLLNITNSFFISSPKHTENKLFILSHHRQILSIRRYMMILYKYLISEIDGNNIITNHINTAMYNSLIKDVFVKIRRKYVDIIQNDKNYHKYWFLIHLSKSAGTSICGTQRDVGYAQLSRLGTNCNIPGHGTPMKNKDIGVLSCNELEYLRQTEDIEFMASERPITGHKIRNKPTLCNKYHYIFPIRSHLRRIASTLSEYNMAKQYFPFQMLIKYGDNKHGFDPIEYWKSQRFKCFNRMITLNNNKTYGSLRDTEDYKDFVTQLFMNERKGNQVEIVRHNNFKCRKKTALDDEYNNLYKYDDMTYITWLDDDKKYALKVTEGFKDRSNISLLRGYCSNTYTRWIGYEQTPKIHQTETTYDAIFEKSYNINITHWLNAIDFLMITDYILPFDEMFEHEIFQYTLRDLWGFKPQRKRVRKRRSKSGNVIGRLRRLSEDDKYIEMTARKRYNQNREELINKKKRFRKRIDIKKKRQKRIDHEVGIYRTKESKEDALRIKRNEYKKMRNKGQRYKHLYNKKHGRFGKIRIPHLRYISKTKWRHSHIAFDDWDKVSSQHLINTWSHKEKEFINNKNLLDIQLFKIAMFIADVDVIFYRFFPIQTNQSEVLIEDIRVEQQDLIW